MALETYLRSLRHEEITEQLNRVYTEIDPEEPQIRAGMKRKISTILKDRW